MSCRKLNDYQKFIKEHQEDDKRRNQPVRTIKELAPLFTKKRDAKKAEEKLKDKLNEDDCKKKLATKKTGTPLKVSAVSHISALNLNPVRRPESTFAKAHLIIEKHKQRQKKLCSSDNVANKINTCLPYGPDLNTDHYNERQKDAAKSRKELRQVRSKSIYDKDIYPMQFRNNDYDSDDDNDGGYMNNRRLHFF
jgi:hypothetical protein